MMDWHLAAKILRDNDPKLWTLNRLATLFGRSKARVCRALDPTYEREYRKVNRAYILARKREYYHSHKTHLSLHRAAWEESKATGIPKKVILAQWGAP